MRRRRAPESGESVSPWTLRVGECDALRARVRHQFRERLTDRFGHRGLVRAEPGQWVARLDVQLQPPPDGDATPGARHLGLPLRVAGAPRGASAPRLAA